MDPTLREHIRGFLSQDEVIERLRGEEDELDALLDLVPVPDLAPHVVHVKPTFEDEDTSYYDDPPKLRVVKGSSGKPVKDADGNDVMEAILHARKTKVRRQVVTDCPDCTRMLTSRPSKDHVYEMFCPRLPRTIELDACHEGCVIACGVD